MFESESSRHRPWLVLALGLSSTLLVGLLLHIQVRSRLRQEAVALELARVCSDLRESQVAREQMQRDLHDGAIQSLYGLRLALGRYERFLERDRDRAGGILEACRSDLDALIAELRTFLTDHNRIHKLAEPLAVADVLTKLRQRFDAAGPGQIQLVIAANAREWVPPALALQLRQIVQEALSNSLRHAQARRITLSWERRKGLCRCIVSDDGCGFDTQAGGEHTRGLANMRARAVEIGAQLKVESQMGRGTRVILDIPFTMFQVDAHE